MKRLVVVGAVVGLTVGIGGGAAWAAVGSGPTNPQRLTQRQLSQPAHVVPALAPVDTSTETKYTSIAPCRAVDTRKAGGALSNGHQRTFTISGTSTLAGQGGSATGCGVPSDAGAVSATITAVASARGYLKAWAYGASQPASSFMNFTHVFNAATGGDIPLGSGKIDVRDAEGPTQVVIDITGYYMSPMWAHVNAFGDLGISSRAASATKLTDFGSGTYQVDFDRDVSKCAYAVANYSQLGPTLAEPRLGDADAVFVQTANPSGAPTDSDFYVTVTC